MIFVLSGASFVIRTSSSAENEAADDDDDNDDDDDDDDGVSAALSDTPQPAKASQLMTARGSHPRR